MADPITTEDLYGKSTESTTPPVIPAPIKEPVAPKPLSYEETPEIPVSSAPSPNPKKKSGCMGMIMTGIIMAAIFILGIWLSTFVRQFFPQTTEPTQEVQTTITPTGIATSSAVTGSQVATNWKTYQVINGSTKQQFAGVTFQLPQEVLAPICDGSGCASQGTYLPGGTRFTVAPRGTGQALADFRGRVVSDVGGIAFSTKTSTIAGRPATEFSGTFTGSTISGYGFSRMRGFMIELGPTTSLEINHFTPNGITADFAKDDILFDSILKTIKVGGSAASVSATMTPTRTPTPTVIVTKTPVASPSGN
jgi:hypothetical protein